MMLLGYVFSKQSSKFSALFACRFAIQIFKDCIKQDSRDFNHTRNLTYLNLPVYSAASSNSLIRFGSLNHQSGHMPAFTSRAFFVSTFGNQLVGRMLGGFKPAGFFGDQSSNLTFGSPFLFGSILGEHIKTRGAAMRTKTPEENPKKKIPILTKLQIEELKLSLNRRLEAKYPYFRFKALGLRVIDGGKL